MKSIIYYIAITVYLTSLLSCQNSLPKYGIAPVQLRNIPFDIDIPAFLSNEYLFDAEIDKVGLDPEENSISNDKNDSVTYYLQYDMYSNPSDINLANYNNLKFKTLEFITDLEEKEVWVWMAKQDTVSKENILQLLNDINDDNKDATISSKDLMSPYRSTLKMVWRTPDRVIKLIIPGLSDIQLKNSSNDNSYYDYYEQDTEQEPFTKEQLLTEFKRIVEESEGNNGIILFIAKPSFDKTFIENSNSSSGTMTSY